MIRALVLLVEVAWIAVLLSAAVWVTNVTWPLVPCVALGVANAIGVVAIVLLLLGD